MNIAIDGLPHTVRQEFPQSLDPDRSSRLVVELAHGLTDRPGRWRDRKSRTLEEALDAVLGEIEVRAAQDARRRQDEQQAIVEREVRWRAAMEVAKKQAVREQLAQVLREEAGRWQESVALSAYCTAWEHRIGELHGVVDEPTLSQTRCWLEWARAYVRSIRSLLALSKVVSRLSVCGYPAVNAGQQLAVAAWELRRRTEGHGSCPASLPLPCAPQWVTEHVVGVS